MRSQEVLNRLFELRSFAVSPLTLITRECGASLRRGWKVGGYCRFHAAVYVVVFNSGPGLLI